MRKLVLGLVAAMFAIIIAARLVFEFTTTTGDPPANVPWSQDSMQFVTWNGGEWTAWVHEDDFEQIPRNSNNWSRHADASLAFTDWDGDLWQAKIEGDMFLLAHRGDWEGEVARAAAIRYRDWDGHDQLRTVTQLRR